MLKTEFKKSIRFKFLGVISGILFVSTVVLSAVIATNERKMLKHSLTTKGQSLASFIANISTDPLILKDIIHLDDIVNEANKDEDIVYTIVRDAQGNIITSQYSSINYRSPRLKAILPELSKDSELPDIIAAIKKKEAVTEISTPILSGSYTIGKVIICMSQHNIRIQIMKIILFVIALNVAVALALGAVLFVSSKKMILTPVAELAAAAARLAKGELSTQVAVKATGELQMLVESFNRMAGDLEKSTISKKTLQTILDSMPYGIIIIDKEKKIQTANHAALALMGYESEDQIAGMICNRTLCPSEEGKCPIMDLKQKLDRSERMLITKGGKRINILKTVVALELDGKAVLLEAVVDITDRKCAEEKLRRYAEELKDSNEDIKSFAYIVSHDLRAPLVNIKGFSKELIHGIREIGPILEKYLDGFPPAEREKLSGVLKKDIPEALSFIGSSVKRMDNLISAILKLSRAGRHTLNPERLSVQDLVGSITASLAHQMEDRNVSVRAEGLPEIVADLTALEQIFGNLLDNAVKYLDPGRAGELEVTAEQNHDEFTFRVRDNGRGIAAEEIPRAFELFRRVGKQDVPGEGMGLAYVKTLVRRHGGRIWCESELGKGSVFSFTIPRKSEEE